MPYSLVSAATLGFDLVRLPAGRSVADVLLVGLAADAGAVSLLAAAHPARGLAPQERGALAVRSRRARELAVAVPHVRTAAATAAAGGGGSRAEVLVDQLERGTIGDAPTLERLLRDDVLGPESATVVADPDERAEAADVLADAALGFWAADVLPPLVTRALTGPFERVRATVAFQAPDLGPGTPALDDFLTRLRGLDGAGRARWRAAVDDGRGERRPWATAMHEACWAAHVTGRIRELAAAQLRAVQAFLDAGFDGRDGAHGVWNAVAGCVQALAMADLLDDGSMSTLLAPERRVSARP